MTDVRDATDALLADRPDLEDDIRTVLDVDANQETWTFDDVPLDSGSFGELVSRGIAEKVDGEYRLANRDAVRAALEGEEVPSSGSRTPSIDVSLDLPPRRVSLALVGALVLVATFRLFAYQSVFRAEHVVLLGNDPYYYRHLLFHFIEQGTGVFSLPETVQVGEPLMLATLLAATKLLGGTTSAANLVLAWYPVLTALVTAGLVYVLTVKLTEDRRVGLAAVVLLAVTPVHAYRTAIGFADHHAFDYLWLALTAVAAVTLLKRTSTATFEVTSLRNPTTLAWTAVLGVGVAAQVLAWNAGPILLLPLAVYGVIRTAAAVNAGNSPLTDLPLVIGIGLGALLAFVVHFGLGWQRLYIVVTPLLLVAGLGAVIVVGEGARRRELSGALTLGGLVATGSLIFAVAYVALPDFAAQFTQEVVRLFVGGTSENIAETASLFSPRYGTIAGPFFFFGLSLFFALPYFVWSLYLGWTENRPAWLLIGSYSSVLFVLALLQVRFAGQLALFTAVFGGLAVVHLLAVTGAAKRPAVLSEVETTHPWRTATRDEPAFALPDRQTIIAVSLIFLLIGGLGAVMTPLRTNLLTVSDESYNAAAYMEDYSEAEGWQYPQNYVFSEWGQNRMYNAIVNGESLSYGYAQQNYEDFLTSTNSSIWYQRLHDRTGFVVINQYDGFENSSQETVYKRLQNWGNETGHYQAVWASDDGSKKVFTLVPGARVIGSSNQNATFTITETVDIRGRQFTYERQVRANASGGYEVRVPYSGTYSFNGTTVNVSETAVNTGQTISVRSNT
ncbi:STT3 domain-containing protein [Halospeciosus flavus]|uniref:dolichyl-phosphooligosaccharide-protein glycotransferase n=1 Tax=Halospeciosus flavus TaxID=3032283 RepID=A0ABD5Z6C3_9EURY|nr:STT3 domain-containing protein [Halospeciosus flavus]